MSMDERSNKREKSLYRERKRATEITSGRNRERRILRKKSVCV